MLYEGAADAGLVGPSPHLAGTGEAVPRPAEPQLPVRARTCVRPDLHADIAARLNLNAARAIAPRHTCPLRPVRPHTHLDARPAREPFPHARTAHRAPCRPDATGEAGREVSHMKACIRDAAIALTAVSTAVALAACGSGAENASPGGNAPQIGVLLPDANTARWETQDGPLLEKKIKEMCADCTVEQVNARNDVATQQAQMDSMITKGVDAIVLVAVDAKSLGPEVRKAHEANIPVIAYDRLAEGPISGYVSFDGEEVGRLQGRALLKAMGDEVPGAQIVMMNGDPSDPNAVAFKKGALSVLNGRVKIGKAYDTLQWRAEAAHMNMSGAIAALGVDNIDGVYAANDSLAAGSISSSKRTRSTRCPRSPGRTPNSEPCGASSAAPST